MALADPNFQPPEDWSKNFKSNIADYPLAKTAWNSLKEAGLEEAARFLLYGYARGAKEDVRAMNKLANNAAHSLKRAARAEKIAHTKAPIRSSDPQQFKSRAQEARRNALRSEWLKPDGKVGTIGHTVEDIKKDLGKEPSLGLMAHAVIKAGGKRSITSSRMYFLMLLHEYAATYGVSLSLACLTALADCAEEDNPGRSLEEGTLSRYLRSIPQASKDARLRDAILPPPVPPKQTV